MAFRKLMQERKRASDSAGQAKSRVLIKAGFFWLQENIFGTYQTTLDKINISCDFQKCQKKIIEMIYLEKTSGVTPGNYFHCSLALYVLVPPQDVRKVVLGDVINKPSSSTQTVISEYITL